MYRDLLASLLLASAGSLALAAPTFNPKSATILSAPSPSARFTLDSLPFADAHERRAWSRHLAKRQVAVPNIAASPVVASPAVVAPVAATAAVVKTPAQAVVPTFVIAEPSTANPVPAAPVAATPAVQSANTPLPAPATTTAAVVPLKNRPVASSSVSTTDAAPSSSTDAASSASAASSTSASASSVLKSSASSVSQSLSATSSSSSPSATSASDSSNGNIFSPSNHLFMVGILVIIGIIVFSILTVIYLVKRLAHSPRYADSRDYPDGFPRDFLDDKALSKRWSHTSQTGLLWEEGAKVPSSSAAEVEVKEVRGTERVTQGTVGREFGARQGGAPLPPVKAEQAPASRWTTFTNAPEPTPLAGRAAASTPPVRPAPPFPPRPSSAVPLHAAPVPPRVSSAPPTLPPKPAPLPPPSARQPNKLVRASTTAAPPSVVRDAHTLQKHRWSPKRESALRNEVV